MKEEKYMDFSEHDFERINLVSIIKKNKIYDLYKCRNCGAEGKRMGLSNFITASKFKPPCKEKTLPVITKIRIIQCDAMGPQFLNLIPGSEHVTVECPSQYKSDDRGVWVMGIGEPVKVLNHEFQNIS